jgi:hypothetical protein
MSAPAGAMVGVQAPSGSTTLLAWQNARSLPVSSSQNPWTVVVARAVLGGVERARRRVEHEPLWVAVPQRVDRRTERIGRCRLAGERQPKDLAGERAPVLREVGARRVAGRHVEQSIGPNGEPRAVVDAGAGDVGQQHLRGA